MLLDGFFPPSTGRPSRRSSNRGSASSACPTRRTRRDTLPGGVPDRPSVRGRRAGCRCGAARSLGRRPGRRGLQPDPARPDPARPDIVLFNGGVFASPLIRQRLLDVLQSWFRARDPDWSPIVLDNDRLDLAVAHGAAYYGTVRRGRGVRIAAGLARTYYIGVESDPPAAVCLVPGNAEPGQEIALRQSPLRSAGPSAGRVSAVRLQHPAGRPAGPAAAGRSRADDAAAADPHGAEDARQEAGRLALGRNSTPG